MGHNQETKGRAVLRERTRWRLDEGCSSRREKKKKEENTDWRQSDEYVSDTLVGKKKERTEGSSKALTRQVDCVLLNDQLQHRIYQLLEYLLC